MRGMGHDDAIESMTFRHVEGNEGVKNRVKRGNGGFFGAKLLKRQGHEEEDTPPIPNRIIAIPLVSSQCGG